MKFICLSPPKQKANIKLAIFIPHFCTLLRPFCTLICFKNKFRAEFIDLPARLVEEAFSIFFVQRLGSARGKSSCEHSRTPRCGCLGARRCVNDWKFVSSLEIIVHYMHEHEIFNAEKAEHEK